jgi:hypothetical protein
MIVSKVPIILSPRGLMQMKKIAENHLSTALGTQCRDILLPGTFRTLEQGNILRMFFVPTIGKDDLSELVRHAYVLFKTFPTIEMVDTAVSRQVGGWICLTWKVGK